jgi:hypothetical protein
MDGSLNQTLHEGRPLPFRKKEDANALCDQDPATGWQAAGPVVAVEILLF